MKKAELLELLHADYGGGLTTLMMACVSLNSELVLRILKAGADVNRQDSDGNTALYFAIQDVKDENDVNQNESKILEIIRLLKSYGADVNLYGSGSQPPIYRAVILNLLRCTKQLIDFEANVNGIYQYNETPLHCAVEHNYTQIIDLLIKSGADINFRGYLNRTSLISVICEKFREMRGTYYVSRRYSEDSKAVDIDYNIERLKLVKRFLKLKADANIQDDEGNTALHYASMTRQFTIVKTLIKNGADMTVKNLEGKDFYDLLLLEDEKYTKSILRWIRKNKPDFVELKNINQDAAKFGL